MPAAAPTFSLADPDVWKALLTLGVTTIGLLLTWFVGGRITAYWSNRQKSRELALALASSFYSHYGEFCSVWKLWNGSLSDLREQPESLAERRSLLLERAGRAEGGIEAVLLKLAAERRLSAKEQADLGSLRQAFQVLRERIEKCEQISYGHSGHRDYLEFKRLATGVGVLLASNRRERRPTAAEAYDAFREITDNKHEPRWKQVGRA